MGNILIFGSFSVRDWELLRQRHQALVDYFVEDHDVFYIERINPKSVGIITVLKAFIKRIILLRSVNKNSWLFAKHLYFIQLKIFPIQRGVFRLLNAKFALFQIRKIMEKHKLNHFDVIIINHPANYVNDIFDKNSCYKKNIRLCSKI